MSDRNNEERFGTPGAPPEMGFPSSNSPPVQHASPAAFQVPTELVDIPSAGKFYPQGHPLHEKTTVEIKYMTAKEEDILTNVSLIKKGIVLDRLLKSVMLNDLNPEDLLIGDKNALLIAARITGYGPDYNTRVTCPSCTVSTEYTFDLSEVMEPEDSMEFIMELHKAELTNNGTFLVTLPKTGIQVEVRPMNGHDEKRLVKWAEKKRKNKMDESPVTDQMKTYITSVNGIDDRVYINSFVDTMPAIDARSLRLAYSKLVPDINLNQQFDCSECGQESRMEVQVNTDFFWPGR